MLLALPLLSTGSMLLSTGSTLLSTGGTVLALTYLRGLRSTIREDWKRLLTRPRLRWDPFPSTFFSAAISAFTRVCNFISPSDIFSGAVAMSSSSSRSSSSSSSISMRDGYDFNRGKSASTSSSVIVAPPMARGARSPVAKRGASSLPSTSSLGRPCSSGRLRPLSRSEEPVARGGALGLSILSSSLASSYEATMLSNSSILLRAAAREASASEARRVDVLTSMRSAAFFWTISPIEMAASFSS
mmetsp:Transcript_7783/g.15872  ORF Transcript_7783/g.15872 Transcript_7783/m.15872 type:complete len:244 (+) Transcript_7783:342-1073(+)